MSLEGVVLAFFLFAVCMLVFRTINICFYILEQTPQTEVHKKIELTATNNRRTGKKPLESSDLMNKGLCCTSILEKVFCFVFLVSWGLTLALLPSHGAEPCLF